MSRGVMGGRVMSRRVVGPVAALAAVVVALVVPAATRATPAVPSSGLPPGPATLADAWPGAVVTDVAGSLPDGSLYEPMVFLDPTLSVGRATVDQSNGEMVERLVVDGPAGVRVLRDYATDTAATLGGVTADGDRVYWLESVWQDDPPIHTVIYYADLPDGSPHVLVTDGGEELSLNSPDDLVLHDGRLWWITIEGDGTTNALRSVAVTGGDVPVEPQPGGFLLTTWPWLTTTGGVLHGPGQVRDPTTGQVIDVAATADQILSCAPPWCRVTTLSPDWGVAEIGVMHPDGSGYQVVSQAPTRYSVGSTPMLLGRFEIEGEGGASALASDKLWLVDVPAGRSVLLSGAYSRRFRDDGAGRVWWTTGDSEALTWHLLDLRPLA